MGKTPGKTRKWTALLWVKCNLISSKTLKFSLFTSCSSRPTPRRDDSPSQCYPVNSRVQGNNTTQCKDQVLLSLAFWIPPSWLEGQTKLILWIILFTARWSFRFTLKPFVADKMATIHARLQPLQSISRYFLLIQPVKLQLKGKVRKLCLRFSPKTICATRVWSLLYKDSDR